MAINIDTVYQRVLAIANKEQRGYITPQEFNLFANQAQIEIFEQYFYDINQFGRLHGNDTEYSDMLNILNEKISVFQRNQTASITNTQQGGYLATFGNTLVTNGTFNDDISNWTAGVVASDNGGTQVYDATTQSIKLIGNSANNTFKSSQSITTTIGGLYRVKASINAANLNSSGSNGSGTARVTFGGQLSIAVNPGSSSTVTFFHLAQAASTDLKLVLNGNGDTADSVLFDNVEVKLVSSVKLNLNSDIYRLGTVLYSNSNGEFVEVDKVLPNEMIYINSSPLTKPSLSSPAYVLEGNSISVYPSSIANGEISYNYIAKPKQCNWAYNVVNEQALYDSTNAINFELHESETVTIVNKILELAGISMQKQDIQATAVNRDNKEVQQEKS